LIASLVMFVLGANADRLYTSTREITDIQVGKDGTLAASTTGGILVRSTDGAWKKYTTLDGLPSNKAALVGIENAKLGVYWNHQRLRQTDTGWARPTLRPRHRILFTPGPDNKVDWQGDTVTLSAQALITTKGTIPLPATSKGTHFTALASNGGILWAGIYGDGIWTYNGKEWSRLVHPPSVDLNEVTVLNRQPGTLWIGTRRSGIYELAGTTWRHHVQTGEPAAHEVHTMAWHDGRLFVATANDGIVSFDGQSWQQTTKPSLTSNSPTALIGFGPSLLVSQGASGLDGLISASWQSRIFPDLPKRGAFCFAKDERTLYIAQGGGWSEFDGSKWAPHLNLKELEGLVPTCLQPDGDNLWIGTQGKGLALFNRKTETLTWFDERAGFEDDWVTCLSRSGNRIYAGTFVGGCMVWDGASWFELRGLGKQHVTAMQPDGEGGLYLATLDKLWQWDGTQLIDISAKHPQVTGGIYSLANSPKGLWVGTSDGIYCLPDA
jgi:ligand-binding sensor domain-containing protein